MGTKASATVLALLAASYVATTPSRAADAPATPRVIKAVRAGTPPTIDGRLDDACWKRAQEVTGFAQHGTGKPARWPTFGYVCYDDAHVYIGMRCLMPKGAKPVGRMRAHDSHIFADDIVEIMLDPGRTRSRYCQLAINAYGARFDCARRQAGAHQDDTWNGPWDGKTHIGDGYWSAELAVPFASLAMPWALNAPWGINLAREAVRPRELSSIGVGGAFNEAGRFAVLEGLRPKRGRNGFRIDPAFAVLDLGAQAPRAILCTRITHVGGSARRARVEVFGVASDGTEARRSDVRSFGAGQTILLDVEPLAIEPAADATARVRVIRAAPKTKEVRIVDPASGKILASRAVEKQAVCEVLRLVVDDPWQRNGADQRTRAISLRVRLRLSTPSLEDGELVVALVSAADGKVVVTKRFPSPRRTTAMRIACDRIAWGAYRVRATFKTRGARTIAAATRGANVLPGGKHKLRVLSNLVTELMDARGRGLLGQPKIDFMNPRDGWCMFMVAGNGRIVLDSGRTPLAVCRSGAMPVEVMRHLCAGRHLIAVTGQVSSLVVRAIPELIYNELGYNKDMPWTTGFGPYDWAFLKRIKFLDNVNVILERNPRRENEPHLKRWRAQGKRVLAYSCTSWITQKPGPVTVASVHKEWFGSRGLQSPAYDGIMIDEFSATRYPKAYPAFTEAMRRLARNPKLAGKVVYPYCSRMYACPPSEAFLQAVLDRGWKWAAENYLTEQPTEQAARDLMNRQLRRGTLCYQDVFPGYAKQMIMCFGFLSAPPETQSIHPGVDFRVYMDMQMRFMATDPAFFGLSGVIWYHSAYADKELMRWCPKLYRHYCIEGRTDRLTSDPYHLPHIQNPDFADGLGSWTLTPAEAGSIYLKNAPGYGYLQGRMARRDVPTPVLVTRRSARAPNRFSQRVRKLVPGRRYSLKLFVVDYGEYRAGKSVKQAHRVSIKLDGVQPVPEESFEQICPSGLCGHAYRSFNRKNNLYITYRFVVFRARKPDAHLVVSDWADDKAPGGPVGRELAFNFIEIQPFIED